MKFFIFVLAVVLSVCCKSVFADACVQCICVADNTCSTVTGCGQTDGCRSVTFKSNCSGMNYLKLVLQCSSGTVCASCYGCAYIRLDGEYAGDAQTDCTSNGCEYIWEYELTYDEEYVLWVCLRSCFGANCTSCTSCTARAYIYNDSFSECNPMPPCNP